jgi:cytochrome c
MAAARALLASVAAGVMALGALAAVAQPAGDPAKGAAVFNDRCTDCHTLGATSQGPNLVGVVGRKAASLPDYPYSDALRASGLTWTPDNLDRFLAGPRKLAPGTAMDAIVPTETERRDLIAYLAAAKG